MNKTFIKIGAVLALIAMLIFVIPFGLPAQYRVLRTVTINAPPAAIHSSVNTLQEWPEWSAWTTEKYPDLKNTYAGPESGVGAINEFEGESLGGGGKFEVTKSHPDEGIEYKLEFHQGSATYPSTGGIKYAKDGDGTKVPGPMKASRLEPHQLLVQRLWLDGCRHGPRLLKRASPT
jgi:hypothetical protein